MVNNKYVNILNSSSKVGGTPVMIIPKAPMAIPKTKTIRAIIVTPARNFPLIIESLAIGCAISLLKEPLFLSPFIESKPRANPTKGPKNDINDINDGTEPLEVVKSLKNIDVSLSCFPIASTIPFPAAKILESPVIAIINNTIKNLLL